MGATSNSGFGSSAETAFYRTEASWNDRDERAAAVADSKRVLANRMDQPYAYLAWSLSTLADGHKSGDRFSSDNYLRGSLPRAIELADLALDRGPAVALGHAHRAFLHLVTGELDGAERELARARQLDANGFHSALYGAVLETERGRLRQAHELLAAAESAVTHRHHQSMLNRVRVRVARRSGDRLLEERLHLENVERNPVSAHAQGSYADFLLRERRVEEAVRRYEQATAIQRYPDAVRGLERARLRLRLSQSRRRSSLMRAGLVQETGRD